MKYNQTAVDAIERFEKTVESLRLDPATAVQLGSILNSVEVQVEENRQVPEVVAHLYSAMQALIRTLPDKQAEQLSGALADCQAIVAGKKIK